MFLRSVFVKGHEYLLLVESRRVNGRVEQRVLRYFGRADRLDREALNRMIRGGENGRAGGRRGALL